MREDEEEVVMVLAEGPGRLLLSVVSWPSTGRSWLCAVVLEEVVVRARFFGELLLLLLLEARVLEEGDAKRFVAPRTLLWLPLPPTSPSGPKGVIEARLLLALALEEEVDSFLTMAPFTSSASGRISW